MTVYILHECSGEYEDARDYIIGVFSTKEKAEKLYEQKMKEKNEIMEKAEIALLLFDGEITEKEAGMTKEEANDWYYSSENNSYYYIGSIEMDTESLEKMEDAFKWNSTICK